MFNKRGQVTIFIILAVIIVAGVAGYFLVRGSFETQVVSANLAPVYNAFLTCLEENTLVGVGILESAGGYIELPEFEKGSAHMPFSSQLNFLGNPVPYWYYVSENGIPKEQVPSKQMMEEQLGNYLEGEINDCILEDYFEQGFAISVDEDVDADITINREEIEVNLKVDLGIEKADEVAVVSNHNVVVKTRLGSLYESARKIYDYEQETLFLENYGIDVLRLYAPVDGVELTCAPLIWSADQVFADLRGAIQANTLALRSRGTDTDLTDEENKYFVLDLPVEEDVRFMNSQNWTYSYEVSPSDENVLVAKPQGNNPGMAIVGLCYVPYHFVYNINYPVLAQVYDGEEIFQFPMAVVIQGNKPREPLATVAVDIPDPELCEYKNTEVSVATYDNFLNPIDADISFNCFGYSCNIGKTENGILVDFFPQCANGFVVARADGFRDTKEYFSTSSETSVDVILTREYEKTIELKIDGKSYTSDAIINFVSEEHSATALYPSQKTVKLSSEEYDIEVYVYRDSSIKLEETTTQQCTEVPRSGIGGILGLTSEECFDVVIPAQDIPSALHGGGKQSHFMSESELESSTTIQINAESLPVPKNIEDIQKNFIALEDQGLDILLI